MIDEFIRGEEVFIHETLRIAMMGVTYIMSCVCVCVGLIVVVVETWTDLDHIVPAAFFATNQKESQSVNVTPD